MRPTAAPVPIPPPPLFLETALSLCEFGGTVGVTVTVRTCPVTVSSDVTGVGVHIDVEDEEEVVLSGVEAALVEVVDCNPR